jgi:hypothetical protein
MDKWYPQVKNMKYFSRKLLSAVQLFLSRFPLAHLSGDLLMPEEKIKKCCAIN